MLYNIVFIIVQSVTIGRPSKDFFWLVFSWQDNSKQRRAATGKKSMRSQIFWQTKNAFRRLAGLKCFMKMVYVKIRLCHGSQGERKAEHFIYKSLFVWKLANALF